MRNFQLTGFLSLSVVSALTGSCGKTEKERSPNILFVISDDQSYPYAGAYGNYGVNTPAFDEVARKGVLFTNAFVAAPQSSPSRAAILTGKNIWQLEEAGTHSSIFPNKFIVFTDLLQKAGYQTGYTGKAWGPGNFKDGGWSQNPVGIEYNTKKMKEVPTSGISKNDYFENFRDFYSNKPAGSPFFFWYGATEPHRVYEEGSGIKAGKKDILIPPFLPDDSIVKSDLLDYALEVEWFDSHLAQMIQFLKDQGEFENTIIIVTADNGMSFPAAKANLAEYGTHVPLAICWPAKIKENRTVHDLVSLIDLAPTFLDFAGVKDKPDMTGISLANILLTEKNEQSRKYVLTGRERHTHARPDNVGYPSRSIRTRDYLFILNLKPDRWPAGDPAPEGTDRNDKTSLWPGYHDIDGSPTKMLMIENSNKWPDQFRAGFEKRPEEELYDIKNDPGCMKNLAGKEELKELKRELRENLINDLKAQGDPRMLGKGDIFESYPRFAAMRNFPGFREEGKYNSAYK